MSVLSRLGPTGLTLALASTITAADFGPAKVPADMGRLVPDGAWAMVYMPSLNHLIQEITPIARAIEPMAAQQLAMMPMMMSMIATEGSPEGGRPAKPATFHLDKPMGIAVGPTNPETGQPDFTIILSADNADKIRLSTSGMGSGPSKVVHLEGTDWVGLSSMTYTPGATPNSICADLFAADISIVIDQATVVRDYGHMIEGMMSAMTPPIPAPHDASPERKEQMATLNRMQEMNQKHMKMFLEGFKAWEFGIDFNGTNLDLLMQYELTSGSPIPYIAGSGDSAKLAALSRQVSEDLPIQFLFDKSSVEAMMALNQIDEDGMYPPETAAKLKKLIPLWNDSVKLLGAGMSGGMSFPDSGFQLMQVAAVKRSRGGNAAKTMLADVVKAWTALGHADLGFTVETSRLENVDGINVDVSLHTKELLSAFGAWSVMAMSAQDPDDMSQTADKIMHAFLGGTSMSMTYIAGQGTVDMAAGNDKEAVRGYLKKIDGSKETSLSGALAKSWADPTWVVSMEMRTLMKQMLEFVKIAAGPMRVMLPAEIPGGGEVRLDMVGSAKGDRSQLRLMTDIAKWVKLIKDVQSTAEKPHASKKAA